MTIEEFLLARVAEDEKVARDHEAEYASLGHPSTSTATFSPIQREGIGDMDYPVLVIDSARVLAECAAKREVVNHLIMEIGDDPYAEMPDHLARHMALVYADHSDYREEWRPT